ncbi:hypothetical protein [Synechococcus sp. EJ6-Ellesmere]|uniref:hypothetical protein n=1 Tax=Synechococcus sp. EJ6-Ellesmere TaxID=2823734 RepID=UPI0020CB9061|nr:hypothetical protein [Synechococcus sp. EJ6-Ellesmere]MCP9823903.1 hypothetical protein [Synechococcus sp. EJ6-Ellesmere]
MSLDIDSRYITGLYALGQWFNVVADSVAVDAYEFIDWDERFGDRRREWDDRGTCYQMGSRYPVSDGPSCGNFENSGLSWANPTGSTGITFEDADTGERVSLCLLEVKAFRERRPSSPSAS